MTRKTRFWVHFRKSRYKGSTVYTYYFTSTEGVKRWRKSHPNTRYYTEIDYAA